MDLNLSGKDSEEIGLIYASSSALLLKKEGLGIRHKKNGDLVKSPLFSF
jgi:hypothetical protein